MARTPEELYYERRGDTFVFRDEPPQPLMGPLKLRTDPDDSGFLYGEDNEIVIQGGDVENAEERFKTGDLLEQKTGRTSVHRIELDLEDLF
jgi:hypothetical protein